MNLAVILPDRILLQATVAKLAVDAETGSFCLLPRHIDVALALAQGLVTVTAANGVEQFIAVDGGILVKRGVEVRIITQRAVLGEQLEDLRHVIMAEFHAADERERMARSAMAQLETGLVRGMLEARRRQ